MKRNRSKLLILKIEKLENELTMIQPKDGINFSDLQLKKIRRIKTKMRNEIGISQGDLISISSIVKLVVKIIEKVN